MLPQRNKIKPPRAKLVHQIGKFLVANPYLDMRFPICLLMTINHVLGKSIPSQEMHLCQPSLELQDPRVPIADFHNERLKNGSWRAYFRCSLG